MDRMPCVFGKIWTSRQTLLVEGVCAHCTFHAKTNPRRSRPLQSKGPKLPSLARQLLLESEVQGFAFTSPHSNFLREDAQLLLPRRDGVGTSRHVFQFEVAFLVGHCEIRML